MHDYHPGTTTLRVGYGAGRLSPLPCLARRKLCFPAGLPVVEISFQCFVLAPSYSRLSTTIASGGLNCRVRNENGCDPSDKALAQNTEEIISADFTTGHRRNAWPGRKLRFPTGQNGCDPTAEAPAQNAQTCCTALCRHNKHGVLFVKFEKSDTKILRKSRDSHNSFREFCRLISTPRLKRLLPFHLAPINVVISHESQRFLILESASRLDAFSGYPFPT